ncbi:hypothetical protein SDC9_89155 [bioreactor metagenome]|uniref:Uncharacterized protein n=1 Tax=bioreactor metagenome TaxID=1076179 RepID=A0A644ZNG5_9ZZZZ
MIRCCLSLHRCSGGQMERLTDQARRFKRSDVSEFGNQIDCVSGRVTAKALEPPVLERQRRRLIIVKRTPRFSAAHLDPQPLRHLFNLNGASDEREIRHIPSPFCRSAAVRFLYSLQSRSKKRIAICVPSACVISRCMPEL